MFLSSINKINITICGMMGSGKSIIGRLIAKKLEYDHIDTDSAIEDYEGKLINEIFINKGEKYFRELEEKIILDILQKKNYVISLGGGSMTNPIILKNIVKNSLNIYLKVDVKILAKRLANSKNRPLIHNKNIKNTLNDLLNKRERLYKKADLIIMNENTIKGSVNEILNKIKLL